MLILEVDDDSDDRELFREAIHSISPRIRCEQVESGVEALAYLKRAEVLPDFIFMDVNMPKMTGYECVNLISTMPKMKPVRIIMHSTSFDPSVQEDFSSRDITYLPKASRFSDLIEGIKRVITPEVKELARES